MPSDFWDRVRKGDGCWVWAGPLISGYGRVSVFEDGKWRNRRAHRIAWESVNGPIPDGMILCHRCDNPPCVRPDHLFLGTIGDNHADMISKGREGHGAPKGERSPLARLTSVQVAEIRARYQPYRVTHRALAAEYGVTEEYIRLIVAGRVRKHDGNPAGIHPRRRSKITPEQAAEIRSRYAKGNGVVLAREYGVSDDLIGWVVAGRYQ